MQMRVLMKRSVRDFGWAALTVAMTSIFGPPVWAYVPPSRFIVKSLVQKRAGFKGFRIRSIVTALEDGQPTQVQFRAVTVFNAQTGNLRSWAYPVIQQVGATGAPATSAAQEERGQLPLFMIERKIAELRPMDSVLLDPSLPRVIAAIQKVGIPIREQEALPAPTTTKPKESEGPPARGSRQQRKDKEKEPPEPDPREMEQVYLGRVGKKISWIIGSTANSSAQLWVEKDSFLPLRLVMDDTTVEMENHRFQKEFPYPRLMILLRDKQPVLRDEVSEVSVNPDLGMFKAALVNQGLTESGQSASSEVQDLMRKYYEFMR